MNQKKLILALALAVVLAVFVVANKLSSPETPILSAEQPTVGQPVDEPEPASPVEMTDTCGLRIYFPHYSKIDLVCGNMPSKTDTSVIMIAEAAFTGELLKEFKHINIAGYHVSGGKLEKGYKCKRNTGAFVYYDGTPQFLYQDWKAAYDRAAKHGGCGFAQEMMIHQGKIVPCTRRKDNQNEFRALCLMNGKVTVADSKGRVSFGDFIQRLLEAGATEALYLDMGPGWNYSWYRNERSEAIEIHSTPTQYATNWITFYQ